MQAQLTDLNARIANLIRIGTVAEVDYSKARARIDLGQSKTNWLPWLTMSAGQTNSWLAPDIGEQVVILSPSGQVNQGVVINGLYHNNTPPPSQSPDEFLVKFGDGTEVSHNPEDKQTSIRSTGQVSIYAAERIVIESNSKVNINAKEASINSEKVSINGDSVAINSDNATFSGNITATGIVSAKNI